MSGWTDFRLFCVYVMTVGLSVCFLEYQAYVINYCQPSMFTCCVISQRVGKTIKVLDSL